jgi:hypothetical protein
MKRLFSCAVILVLLLHTPIMFLSRTAFGQGPSVTLSPTTGLRVRTEPSIRANIITTIQPGTAYPVLGQTTHGYWYQIQLSDQLGWVCQSFAELSDDNLTSSIPLNDGVTDQDCRGNLLNKTPTSATTVTDITTVPDNIFIVYTDSGSPNNHFVPSGFMGDAGDIAINQEWTDNPHSGTTAIQITYFRAGVGPNICEYGSPCKWAGVYWQNPGNNWGAIPGAGFDLSGMQRISFWARSDSEARIEFKVGGITGPYPDSLQPARSSGILTLTSQWQWFHIPLADADLSYVIGGLCWVTNWYRNSAGPVIFYLDDIVFER